MKTIKQACYTILTSLMLVMTSLSVQAEGGRPDNIWGGGIGNAYNTAISNPSAKVNANANASAKAAGIGIGIGGEGGRGGDGGDAHQGQAQLQKQQQQLSNGVDINIEADDYPVSGAYAGTASGCVNTAGVQSESWGASIGGASAECLAQIEARFLLEAAAHMNELGLMEERNEFLGMAIDSIRDSQLNDFQRFTKNLKDWAVDAGIPASLVWIVLAL